MGRKSSESRRIVLDILSETENEGVKFNLLLRNAMDKADYMDRQDKAFISRLSKGCVERRITLDYIINKYAKTGNKKIKPVIRNILRMSLYQMLYMDSVKDFAACSEAVNLTKERGLMGLTGFVNGVLRNILRDKDADRLPFPARDKDYIEYLSVMYSMPKWIAEYFLDGFGPETTEKIFEAYNQEASLTVRLNEKLSDERIRDIISLIEKSGVVVTPHPYSKYAYILEEVSGIYDLPGFAQGLVIMQDVSSQLDIALAGIREGDNILDMCAAPGGKAMHAALLAGDKGHVTARDISDNKLELIRENAERLHIENMEYELYDASEYDESSFEKYDVVILDAPCSGLGVIGRKADIRYRLKREDIDALSSLQKKMIDNAVKYVKKGGKLIYSTCTLSREENEDNREYILQKGLTPTDFTPAMNDALKNDCDENCYSNGYIRLLPGTNKNDGFFISGYIKK